MANPVLYNVQTRQPEQLDGADLQKALLSGTHSYEAGKTIDLFDPQDPDQRYTVPSQNVTAAMQQKGLQVVTPAQQSIDDYVSQNSGAAGAAKVFAKEFVNQGLLGIPGIIHDKTADPLELAKEEALNKENRFAQILGGVGGFGASLLTGAPLFEGAAKVGGAAELLADRLIAKSGGELTKRTAMQVAGDIARGVAAKGAGGAAEGAVLFAPQAITEAMLGDPDQASESMLAGVGIGSLFGVGGYAAKELLGFGKKAAEHALTGGKQVLNGTEDTLEAIARKTGKIFTGVPEEDQLYYMQNPDRIENTAQEKLALVGGDKDRVLEPIQNEIDNHITNLGDQMTVAKQAADEAKTELDRDYRYARDDLTNKNAPTTVATNIMGALENEKSVIGDLSNKADQALANSGVTVKKQDLIDFVQKGIDGLGPKIGDETVAAAKNLENMKKNLITELPETVDAPVIRKVLQQVRADAYKTPLAAGEFNTTTNAIKKDFGHSVSELLKDGAPEYQQLMDQMHSRGQLLDKMSEAFGTEKKAYTNLNNIFAGGKSDLTKSLLEQFSTITGHDFMGELAELKTAEDQLHRIKRGDDLRGELLPGLTQKHAEAKAAFEKAKEIFSQIKGLTPARTQSILTRLGTPSASNLDRKAIETLGNLTGKNFLQEIDDVNNYRSFYKDRTNGSKRTSPGGVVGSVAGGSIGAAIGGAVAGPIGMGIGGSVGSFLGGTAGGALGSYIDTDGGSLLKRYLKSVSSPSDKSGLLFTEKMMKKTADKLDQIPEILKSMASITPATGRGTSTSAMARVLGSNEVFSSEKHRKSVERRMDELNRLSEKTGQLVSNPDMFGAKLAELSDPLKGTGAPIISQFFSQKMLQSVQYLQDNMPKPPRPNTPFSPNVVWKPSDSDLSRFEQRLNVVMDPFVVLTEMKHNTLTKTHIETLKAVYPKTFQQMQTKLIDATTKGIKPIPYNQRTKLSLLFEVPLDTSQTPKSILAYQVAFSQPDPTIDPTNKRHVDIAKQATSDIQKLNG